MGKPHYRYSNSCEITVKSNWTVAAFRCLSVVAAWLEAVSLSQRIFPTGFACKFSLHMESRHFKASNPGTPTAHAASTKDTTHGQPYAALKEPSEQAVCSILLEAKQARTMPCYISSLHLRNKCFLQDQDSESHVAQFRCLSEDNMLIPIWSKGKFIKNWLRKHPYGLMKSPLSHLLW